MNLFEHTSSILIIKKYVLGKLSFTADELEKIQEYIFMTYPKLVAENADTLLIQIEHEKVPYIKYFTIKEFAYIRSKNIDLNGIKYIIIAKNDYNLNMGSIYWNEEKEKYIKLRWQEAMIVMLCFTILSLFVIPMPVLYPFLNSIFNIHISQILYGIILLFYVVALLSGFVSFYSKRARDILDKNYHLFE